ncbi:fasciclin domain-containing protein [Pontibacter harenae]|uniref:fasciclin domain-containing protein n=1 Tax=Pontibacter harenae TaxID=2894083 RepID=UPI001E50FC95|nr:fasciclin domain-containing protein [Pontibacter harenae]MCC9166024.1 fasciclin domain-containing protein [Pontibacter harenae]
MKITKVLVFGVCFSLSGLLYSCGTNEENADNEAQRETGSSNLRTDNQVNPGSAYDPGSIYADDIPENGIGDNVIVPSRKLMENIASTPRLTTFTSVLKQAGLVNSLNGTGPYTVFAPTNDAFEAMEGNSLKDLVQEDNRQQLTQVLNNHIVSGQITAADLQDGAMLKTVGGQQLRVTKQGDRVLINGATVEMLDGVSGNGVIHVIDRVLQAGNTTTTVR